MAESLGAECADTLVDQPPSPERREADLGFSYRHTRLDSDNASRDPMQMNTTATPTSFRLLQTRSASLVVAAMLAAPALAAVAAVPPPGARPALAAASSPAATGTGAPVRLVDAKVAMPEAARPHTAVISVDRAALEALAASGGGAIIDFPLGPNRRETLALAPIEALEQGAAVAMERNAAGELVERRIEVGGAFLAGSVVGFEGSHAFIAASDAGTFGYVEVGEKTYIISSGPLGARLPTVSYDLSAMPEGVIETTAWTCGVADPAEAPVVPEGGIAGTNPCRQIRVAYETDYEFTQLFGGNGSAAAGYIATLASSLTSIYQRDVNARLSASYVRLWIDPFDPWTGTSTSAQLNEFRGHWESFMTTVPRDLAHFLSGRGLGGGIAYLPGLCAGAGFGLSANLAGFYPTPLLDNNGQNWDMYVVSHELGHNFGAPHTHNYNPPLDGCGSSPADCTAADQDIGTIMSYCHLCSGGVSNIKLKFHPGNIASIDAHLAGTSCNYTGPARAPVAVADTAATFSNVPVTLDVLANDLEFNCESVVIELFQNPTPNGGTVTRSVGTGPGGRDQLVYLMPSDSFGGTDTFTYRIKDPTQQWINGTVNVGVTALRAPENPINALAQLDAKYYALTTPSVLPNYSTIAPYLTTTVAQVNYASTNGNFANSTRSENLGALYTGWVDIPASGQWTFFLSSDDGSRLSVGSTVVVDHDGVHGFTEKSGSIGLAAGRHALRIEFFERSGGAGLVASWQGPGVAKAPIPTANLLRGGVDSPADVDNDGFVNAADVAAILNAWGTANAAFDLNADGVVSGADLTIVLNAWTG